MARPLITSRVRIDIAPINFLRRNLDSRNIVIRTMLKRWAKRYEVYTRRRYLRLSGGGGEWKPLKGSTLMSRRSGTAGGSAKILRDTGTVFNALTIGQRGNHQRVKRSSVEYGFANTPHPSGKIGIRELAIIHDQGKGNVPARPILVVPDGATRRAMLNDARRAQRQLLGKAKGRLRMKSRKLL